MSLHDKNEALAAEMACIGAAARAAARPLREAPDRVKTQALRDAAEAIRSAKEQILSANARDMEAALKAAGKTVKLVVYPGAYHRFDRGAPAFMQVTVSRDGYIYQYDEAATRDAWKRTREWLRKYLGT